jgi:hypothetical protein
MRYVLSYLSLIKNSIDMDPEQHPDYPPDHPPVPPPEPHIDADDDNNNPDLMRQALIRLGLAPIAAQEFINNGITTPEELRVLSSEHLFRLIKQIHRDNMNGIFRVVLYGVILNDDQEM